MRSPPLTICQQWIIVNVLWYRYRYSYPYLSVNKSDHIAVWETIFFKLANKYQIPYFTDDRSIFFPPQHAGFDLSSTSTYTRMKLKKSGIPQKNLNKNDDFVYSTPLFCCSFFFWIRRLKSSMFLVLFFFK